MTISKTLSMTIVAVLMGGLSLSASAAVAWDTDFASATQLSDLQGTGQGQFNSIGTKGSGTPTVAFDNANDVIQLRTYNYTDTAPGYPYAGVSQQDFRIGEPFVARYELVITPQQSNGTSGTGKRGLLQIGSAPIWDSNLSCFAKIDLYFTANGLVLQNQGNASQATSPLTYGVAHRIEFLCVNSLSAVQTMDLAGGGTAVVSPGTMQIFVDGVYDRTFTATSGKEGDVFKGFQVNIGGHQVGSTYSMRGIDIHSLTIHAVATDPPLKILFIGNSYTNNTPIVSEFRTLVGSAGFLTPTCSTSAIGGYTLQAHSTNATTMALVDGGGWDYVVLQEYSTRPTVSPFPNADPARFELDAAWFYDRIKATSPNAKIVMYETWARHENNISAYPIAFANRDDMQGQLTYWYHDVVEQYIPTHVTWPVKTDVFLAPCGEVWQANYHGRNYLLHADDLHHQNATGTRVNAMTFLGALYKCRVSTLPTPADRQERYLRTLVDQTNSLYYDIGADNYGPDVDAGEDQTIQTPTVTVALNATVSDDGMPNPPAAVTPTWTKQSGPGTVTFADPHAASTTATLPGAGVYVLRVTVSDGELQTYDEVTITCEARPYLVADRIDLGGGLFGWSFSIANQDGLLTTYTVALGFQGAGGGVIQQIKSGAVHVNKEGWKEWDPEYQEWNGEGAILCDEVDAAYDMTRDTWASNPFGDNGVPGINPLTGGSLNGVANGANTFAMSCHTGTGSALGDDVSVAYVVATGNVSWTGTIGRNGQTISVEGVTGLPSILGDFNADGTVTHGDYTVWADNYGLSIAAVQAAHPTWFPLGSYPAGATMVTQGLYTTWADHFGDTAPLTVGQSSLPAVVDDAVATAEALSGADKRAARVEQRRQRRLERIAARHQRRSAKALAGAPR